MKKIKILKKTFSETVTPVYDIEVKNNHHYILENGVVSHNSGPIYAASILLVMGKRKLKEDEEGNKVSEVLGIRSAIKCMKTRFNKPFEEVVVQIPYETGMNPYSGLIELFEKKGFLIKDGNKLKYTYLDGREDKWFRKQLIKDPSILMEIMEEFPIWQERKHVAKKAEEEAAEKNESSTEEGEETNE